MCRFTDDTMNQKYDGKRVKRKCRLVASDLASRAVAAPEKLDKLGFHRTSSILIKALTFQRVFLRLHLFDSRCQNELEIKLRQCVHLLPLKLDDLISKQVTEI